MKLEKEVPDFIQCVSFLMLLLFLCGCIVSPIVLFIEGLTLSPYTLVSYMAIAFTCFDITLVTFVGFVMVASSIENARQRRYKTHLKN